MNDPSGPGRAIRDHTAGALLDIHVQPRAARTEWAGFHGGALKYRVAAVPSDDRANDALRAFLAGQFGIGVSRVTILRGQGTRRKQVLLRGLAAQRVRELVQSAQRDHRDQRHGAGNDARDTVQQDPGQGVRPRG